MNGSALIAVWTETPPSRNVIVETLHAAIPPGARVLGPAREWYAFVGRNPAIGMDGRSLPQFGTTLTQSAKEFGAEYVVLIRDGSGAAPLYWVDERDPLVARVVHSTRQPDDGVVLRSIVAGEEVVVAEVR